MSEDHGYQRSGKKCREKFENLYKYYKKTKEGKAGRHDGKHYRFFRQLEALYGDRTSNGLTTSSVPGAQAMVNSLGSYHPSIISPQSINASNDNHELSSHQSQKAASDSLSLSGSSDFDTSSSNDDDDSGTKDPMVESTSVGTNTRVKKRGAGRSWKAKIKDFIDSRMRKLIEKQEEWVEKMMRALEEKEQERLLREEEWRRQEIARIDKEHKFWAKERAWIEARDAALMEAIHNLTSRSSSDHMMSIDNDHVPVRFESEKANKTKTNADGEDMAMDGSMKKGEEYYDKESKGNLSSRCSSNNYFQGDNISLCDQRPGVAYCEISEQGLGTARVHQLNDSFPPSNSIAGNVAPDSCFRFLMGDGENLWENYGMKLNKGEN